MQIFKDKWERQPKNADLERIRKWFDSDLGRRLVKNEKNLIDAILPGLYGYHLVEMGMITQSLSDASQINHRLSLGLAESDLCNFKGSALQLPFGDDSIDLVFLHHLLDFYGSPKKVLKEAARVIQPSGHLVVVGFNPLSLWGLWKSFARVSARIPWNAQFIAPGRLMDWLNLLGFRIDRIHYAVGGLPLVLGDNSSIPDYSDGLRTNWPFGAVYVIVAQKQHEGVTPLKSGWLARDPMPRLSVVRTSHQTREGTIFDGNSPKNG